MSKTHFKAQMTPISLLRQSSQTVKVLGRQFKIPERTVLTSNVILKKVNPSLPNLATPEEATKKTEIKRKFFARMFDFIGDYSEKVLSSVLPEVAMKAVKTFSKGTKALYGDMKQYAWINSVLSRANDWENACKNLSRRQLEVILGKNG